MKRIRLTTAYDGTCYSGFQKQPGRITIEGELTRAAELLTGEKTVIYGASRTDAGVHARGNIAVFDTESAIPPEKFSLAMNTKLPPDIRVVASGEVPLTWEPRKQETVKTYRYRINNALTADPFTRRFVMHFPRRLDIMKMREASGYLVGEHDFTSFCNPASQVLQHGGSAVRKIYSIEISGEERGEIRIAVTGNGFLYHMVRILSGTLMDTGAGRFRPEEIPGILAACDRTAAGFTAEACGLTLWEIRYPQEELKKPEENEKTEE